MTTAATRETVATARERARPARGRLGRRPRQAVLIAHIVAAGAWLGIDVVVAVLVGVGAFAPTETAALAYQALGTFVVVPMLLSGLLTLGTGLLLGWGTKWGLVRYRWVAVKLVVTVALCTLIVVLLEPGMAEVAEYGRTLPDGATAPDAVSELFFPPAVSLIALTFAIVLSVVKPWGRTRRRAKGDRG